MTAKILFAAGIFSFSSVAFAQVNLTTLPDTANIPNGTPFLDASSYYDESVSGSNNIGKGLVFPRVDLINFEFNIDQPDGANILPTYYDGMIVYNTSTGTTLTTGNKRSSTATAVTPGFYYFSNPNSPSSVTTGKWVRIGSGEANSKIALTQTLPATQSAAVATNLVIDSKEVFAVKGSFVLDGNNTVTIIKPEGFKTMVSIKIFRKDGNGDTASKQLVGTSLYSYEEVGTNQLKLFFGSGGILSLSYPKGNYEYVVEYLK